MSFKIAGFIINITRDRRNITGALEDRAFVQRALDEIGVDAAKVSAAVDEVAESDFFADLLKKKAVLKAHAHGLAA